MTVRVDAGALVRLLDERLGTALPETWPGRWGARSSSIGSQFLVADLRRLTGMPLDLALHFLVEYANEAIYQYSDGVSEDTHEPYNGMVSIDGDVLRVRFGRLPRSRPDEAYSAPELEPIPISQIISS